MSQSMKQALKSNALYSPLPTSLAKVIGLIADHLNADCRCELAWPGEDYLAKKCGLSARQIRRIIRQVKIVGCFEIKPMNGRELKRYAWSHYQYNLDIGNIQHKINAYRPNPEHFLCRQDGGTEQEWMELMRRLQSSPPTRRVRGTHTNDGTRNVLSCASYHSTDTGVLSSQELTPQEVGGSSVITEKTRKNDACLQLPQEAGGCNGIEANRIDEADGCPYLDEEEWEQPPRAAGRYLSLRDR
jgi:hypothetical protein